MRPISHRICCPPDVAVPCFRGDPALIISRLKLVPWAAFALLALRVTIGLHFSVEGINKFVDPKPFTAGFMVISKGPFAPLLKSMVWDRDGLARLDEEASKKIWEGFEQTAIGHFGLDPKRAAAIRKTHEDQLKWHLESNASDIHEYKEGLKRRDLYAKDHARNELTSLWMQNNKIESELTAKRVKLLTPIDAIWASYESDINAAGTSGGRSPLVLPKVGRKFMDTEMIDIIIKYFDVVVGVLLICGLFTRVAALAGSGFLVAICASQFPFYFGAAPIWYQLIEAVAMLVLAATGAGQYAGFDYLYGPLRQWCCPTKQGTNA
jgi:uncharacterized membrane protein YphA (DoxX/SURF4 family)